MLGVAHDVPHCVRACKRRHSNAMLLISQYCGVCVCVCVSRRCLSHSAVAESLDEMLTPSELDQLMRRRDDVLRYFDELVAEKGYEDVVIDC